MRCALIRCATTDSTFSKITEGEHQIIMNLYGVVVRTRSPHFRIEEHRARTNDDNNNAGGDD